MHPDANASPETYRGVGFNGLGLVTSHPFNLAYLAAEAFTDALRKAIEGCGLHEDFALAADLFELRIWPCHG